MNVQLKDYGVSTVIAIDDIFNEIDIEKNLSDFSPEIIDNLTDGQYDAFSDWTIAEYVKNWS